jgi:hypothetical protein
MIPDRPGPRAPAQTPRPDLPVIADRLYHEVGHS